jgi:gliding motility-associated lipoprotein GldH
MKAKHITYFIISVFLLSFLVSCSGSFYDKSYGIENEVWQSHKMYQFHVEVDDMNSRHNIFIHLRNSTEYLYSNIFLFVHVLYPDNTELVDTVEGILSDHKGEWLGSGSGRLKSNSFLYKSNIQFPQQGTYIFTIEQAMRDHALEGISSVGLEIVKIKMD